MSTSASRGVIDGASGPTGAQPHGLEPRPAGGITDAAERLAVRVRARIAERHPDAT